MKRAVALYRKFGFEASPLDPKQLMFHEQRGLQRIERSFVATGMFIAAFLTSSAKYRWSSC